MALPPRLFVFAALAVAPAVLFTGCGEDATGARTTVVEVQGTNYVVEDPVTTTTTTTTLPLGSGEVAVDPNEQQYIVQAGDSVYAIANDFGIEPEVLANYNSWPEGIGHAVFVGDIIRIPPNSQVAGAEDTSEAGTDGTEPDDTETTEADAGVGCTHTVVAGDNPTRLSEQYEVTLEELNAANANNPAYGHFQLGSQINIPLNGNC